MTNIKSEQKVIYNELVELLNLSQYSKLMGGDMSFADKARRAKLVSKSRKVHELADLIMLLARVDATIERCGPKVIEDARELVNLFNGEGK